ncbi:MAG TPA: enolase C-terminal domain-like protein [Polyangiales bacterium]|nr:enolase C-terminal domain-like protein [Polyangiales bacterium]
MHAHPPLCLLEVTTTDEALVGTAVGREDVIPAARALLEAWILGEDPRSVTGLWHRLNRGLDTHGAATPARQAAALLDIALWDLKAKARNEPLWKTLGGSRPRVPVHGSARPSTDSDQSLHDHHAGWARDYGIRAGTLRVGIDRDADLRRIEFLQRALHPAAHAGPPTLILDADALWSPKEAIRNARALERAFDIAWVEAPTNRHDFLGLKRVSSAIRAAVCGGAGLDGFAQFLSHLHHRSLDIIQLDPSRLGITGALQLADAAFGLELPVVLCDAPGNLNAQLAGALPNVTSLEVSRPEPAFGTLVSDVRIEQGWAVAGDRPGHGLHTIHGSGAGV